MKLFGGDHFRSSLRHFLLGRAMQALLAITLTLLTIRVMAPTDYGIYLLLFGISDLLRPLSSLGVLPTVQRFLPEMALHATSQQLLQFVRVARWIRWGLLSFLVGVLSIAWQYVIDFAGVPHTTTIVMLLTCSMVFLILALEYSEATLESVLDQKSAQLARVTHVFLRLVGVVVLSATDQISVINVLACEVLAAAIGLIVSEVRLGRRLKGLSPDGSRLFVYKDLFSYGFHLSLTQVIYAVATPGVLRMLVSRQLGVEAAGYFGFMQALLLQFSRLMPSLLLVNLINPMLIAATARGASEKVGQVCGFLFKTNVLIVWPIFPFMLLFGDQLMAIVSGGRLVEHGLSMSFLVLGLSAITQVQVATTVMQVHRMSGRLVGVGSLFLLLPVFVFLGAQYSLLLTCIGFFIASALRQAVAMWVIQSSSARVIFDVWGSLRYFLYLCASFFVALIVQPYSQWWSLAVFLFGVFLAVLFARPLSKGEYSVMQEATKKDLRFLNRFVEAR